MTDMTLCPPRWRAALRFYLDEARPVGGFLEAVLANDLQEAIGRADPDSLESLPALVRFIYNGIPSNAWGSRSTVKIWTGEAPEGPRTQTQRIDALTQQRDDLQTVIAATLEALGWNMAHSHVPGDLEPYAHQLKRERDALAARLARVAPFVRHAYGCDVKRGNVCDCHKAALVATDTEAPQARDERVRAEERRRCEDGWAGVSATMTEVRSRNKVTILVDALAWDTLRSTMGERTGLRRDDDYPGRLPTTDTEEGAE